MLNPVIRQVMAPYKAALRGWPPRATLGAKALEIVMESNVAKVRWPIMVRS